MDESEISESTSQVSSESSARTRSFVWKYFKKDGSYAKCDICEKKLKCINSSTSSLKKHLKSHKDQIPELNINQQSNSLREPFNSKKFIDLIKRWIVIHNRPF